MIAAQVAESHGFTVRALPLRFYRGFTDFYLQKYGGKTLPIKYSDANLFLQQGYYGVGEDYGVLSIGDLLPIEGTLIKDPTCGTSKGIGEVVNSLLVLKKKRIVIALPEGCFFDLGVGFLSALGGKFYNERGEAFLPVASSLSEIKSFDLTEPKNRLKDVKIELFIDKNRPLRSALSDASAFGARKTYIDVLENNIEYLVSQTDIFDHTPDFDGAGEGGGFCYMATSLFHASVRSFSDLVFEEIQAGIDDSDLVVSGEIGYFSSVVPGLSVARIAELSSAKNKPFFPFSDDEKYGAGSLFSADKTRKDNRILLPDRLRSSLEGIFAIQ